MTNDDTLLIAVQAEYKRTGEFIDGITTASATVRGLGVTIWLALLGVAFDRSLWELGVLAAITATIFWLIDGYHAWLYGEAFRAALELELIQAAAYAAKGRLAGQARGELEARARLQAHQFGLYRNFKRFRLKDLRYVRPYVFFRLFYPFLVAVGAAAAIFLAAHQSKPSPTCKVVSGTHGRALECGGVVIVGSRLPVVRH
jgi:hypothetical protein